MFKNATLPDTAPRTYEFAMVGDLQFIDVSFDSDAIPQECEPVMDLANVMEQCTFPDRPSPLQEPILSDPVQVADQRNRQGSSNGIAVTVTDLLLCSPPCRRTTRDSILPCSGFVFFQFSFSMSISHYSGGGLVLVGFSPPPQK